MSALTRRGGDAGAPPAATAARARTAPPVPVAPAGRLDRAFLPAWVRRHAGLLTATGLALLVCAPLLRPGYVLTYDMVFVPHPRLGRELLGLGPAVARAVPSDLLVALASRLLPADLLQKLLLLGSLAFAGCGTARLAPSRNPAARAAAACFYLWNAYVYERLLLGHWALLLAYAALPWVAAAALAYRRAPGPLDRRALRRLAAPVLAAACAGAPGALLATMTALLVSAVPTAKGPVDNASSPPSELDRLISGGAPQGRGTHGTHRTGTPQRTTQRQAATHAATEQRPSHPLRWRQALGRAALVMALGLVISAPWLVPSLLRPGGVPVRPLGVAAFAPRADVAAGTLASLVTLGGVWNALVAPPGRDSWLWLPGALVVLAVAVAGWRVAARRLGRGAATGLLAAAALGLLLAAAPALPGLQRAVLWAVTHLPGGGVIRDSQKFVASLALVEAVGFGVGVERALALARRHLRRPGAMAVTAVLAAAPLLLLPALAWGAGGRLAAVRYPRSFAEARAAMAADPVPGAVLVLPWHLYLGFTWNNGRIVLDPAQRLFTRRAVTNDDLELTTLTVPGEDPWSSLAAPLVRGGGPLVPGTERLGVRWVLLLKTADWARYPPRLTGTDVVLDRPELALYRAPAPAGLPRLPSPPAGPVLAADAVTAALALWVVGGTVAVRARRLVWSSRGANSGGVAPNRPPGPARDDDPQGNDGSSPTGGSHR